MERLSEMIKILSGIQGFISIDDLAKDLDVTPRTIRNDLMALEKITEGSKIKIVKKRNQGIALDRQNLSEKAVLNLIAGIKEEKNFYSAAERENMIMEALLLEKGPLTLNRLEELTLSSKSSVVKSLDICERKLGKWQITVSRRPRNGMKLEYAEYQWRMAVLEHMMQYVGGMDFHQLYDNLIKGNQLNITLSINQFIGTFVYDVNTRYIANFLRKYEADHKMRFTDKAFLSIFFYICIAMNRICSGHELQQSHFELRRFFHKERVSEQALDHLLFLNRGLKENMNYYEREALLIYMLSQKQFSEHGFLEQVFIEDDYFNKKTLDMTKQFIRKAEDCLNIELEHDEALLDHLLLHVRPMIFRLLFGIRIENPLAEDIKKTYPMIVTACQEAAKLFSKETGNPVNIHEISYLAMHVGAAVEKAKEKQFAGVCRVMIICPEGNGSSSILYYRLLNSIPNLQIKGICSIGEWEETSRDDVDLFLSTVPIYTENQMNLIQVNPLLNDEDIAKIRRTIKRMNLTNNNSSSLVVEDMMAIVSRYASIQDFDGLYREMDQYFNYSQMSGSAGCSSLRTFLNPSLIMTGATAENWEEAFRLAGNLLYREGYIEKGYISCMIQNVRNYGCYMMLCEDVALPHAKAADGVIKTGFSFVTLKTPVILEHEQETHEIRLVVALAADNRMTHLTAMGELIELVCQDDKKEQLIQAEDAEMFIRLIEQFISGSSGNSRKNSGNDDKRAVEPEF